MASCSTTQVAGSNGNLTSPYVTLTVEESSHTDTTVTLSYVLKWYHPYSYEVNQNGRAYTITIDGTQVASGSYVIYGKATGSTITSGTKTVNKSTSSRNVSFGCSFTFGITWGGNVMGTRTASSSISIGAKTSYKIQYNANGGSGAPSAQTKYYGTTLTLSSTKPTCSGYAFIGWATSSNGSVAYQPGGSYTANQAATLYAKWSAGSYTVSYDANGGSGAPASQTKTYNTNLTLSSTIPTRSGYSFKGWATSSNGSVAYSSGGTYSTNASVTLYAVWESSYVPPTISNLKAVRSDSGGTATEGGTYAKVTFDWSTCQETGSNDVGTITINCNNTNTSVSASGTSDSVTEVVGANALSIDNSYPITVTVTDNKSGSTTKSTTLPNVNYSIDFKAGGTGVAIGKIAETDNLFDVKLPTMHHNDIILGENNGLRGYDSNGNKKFIAGLGDSYLAIGSSSSSTTHTGDTYIRAYSGDIRFNCKYDHDFRPYYCKGDSISIKIFTAGFLTSSKTKAYFIIPLSKPVIGSPTVTASTNSTGFALRQAGNYTHGSAATTYIKPSSYSCSMTGTNFIRVAATFSTTTNAVNNDVIGVEWDGTITFS